MKLLRKVRAAICDFMEQVAIAFFSTRDDL
jgi:hypothetical protein